MKRTALFLALFSLATATAAAQSPLERRVTVHLRDVALREALDRIALLANLRFSYSGDNLPLDRRVSLARDTSSVAEVLAELLRAYPIEPVVVSSDHVVLTPRAVAIGDSVQMIPVLDRVVVTGSVIGAPERPLPIALDVLRGRELERRDEAALAKVFSGSVPGVWLWEHTPTSMLARYGSIRGSSSFGLSFPKVYIDGIEVANPLLLTQITPELVERIEVIRGPQGAALYGSDAISGVVNIVSRHEGVGPDGTNAMIRSSLGYASSAYMPTAVAVQEHALTLRAGSNLRSAGVTIGGATSGQYVPQAYSRELRAIADARRIGSRSTLTANARFYAKNAGVPVSPLLAALSDELESDDEPQQLRMYSAGSTFTLAPTGRWTYSATAGVDGYALSNVSIEQSAIPSVADTALRNASGSATRGTLRASAVTSRGAPDRIGATLIFVAEQSVLNDRTLEERPQPGSGPGRTLRIDDWSSNTGVSAQGNLALRDLLYFTAGVRRERLGQTRAPSQYATLPMLGMSLVRDHRLVTWKLRTAYGKGVRATQSNTVMARQPRRTMENPNLQPEQQSGIEAGIDLTFARMLAIHLTRFDQLATGLIQTVTVTDPSGGNSGPGNPQTWYQLQNLGQISNRGWEAQATLVLGPASLAGAASFVDSRVQRLAIGYTGDLRPGDRMLAVPARTLSGTISIVRRGYSLSSTLSRASDWINYDRLAIADSLIASGGTNLTGDNLRPFWVNYPGTTRLRAAASTASWRGVALTITGENLLNYQRGEPDTITIVPGRTISVGVKARF
jgi:outer membrane receptor protein involved in Fe transport